MGTMRGSGPGVGESGAREGHGSGTRGAAGARREDRGPAPRRLQKGPPPPDRICAGPRNRRIHGNRKQTGGCRGLPGAEGKGTRGLAANERGARPWLVKMT